MEELSLHHIARSSRLGSHHFRTRLSARLPAQYREALTRAGYEDIDSLADLDWSDFEKVCWPVCNLCNLCASSALCTSSAPLRLLTLLFFVTQIEGFTGVAIPPGHRKRLMAAAQRLCPEAAGRVPFSDAPAAAWSHDSPPQQQQDSPGLLPVAMGGAERPLAAAATAGDLQFFGLGPPAGQARSGGGGAQQSAALKAAQRFALPGSLGSSGELAAPQSGQSPPSSPLGQQSAGVASRAQRPDAPQPQGGRGRAQHASQKENSPSAARGREQAARSAAEATAAAASKGNAEAAARGAFPAVAVFGPKLPPLAPAEQDRAGGARPRPEPAAHAPTATPQQQQQQRWVSPSEGRPPPGAQPDPARADAQQKAIAELHLGLQQRRAATPTRPCWPCCAIPPLSGHGTL